MKKIALTCLIVSSNICLSLAQDKQPGNMLLDSLKRMETKDIDWLKLINTDYVSIGNNSFNINSLPMYSIVRVRFYRKEMSPIINIYRDGERSLPFLAVKNSRIIEVKSLSDGGVGVILATGDRLGPFIESIKLRGNYNTTFQINGIVQNQQDKEQEK